jgi:hypothetical protein
MRYGKLVGAIVLVSMLLTLGQGASAQVTPEVQLGARGVLSVNTDVTDGNASESVSDFSDTSVLLGFRQKLYNRFRGRLVVGFQFPDAESDLGQVFFHQTFVQVEDRANILKIGRARVKSELFDFPTLRDDDALLVTTVLNPFSSGDDSEDHQYGNVLEVTHIFGQRLHLRLHTEHFRETPPPGAEETDFGFNAVGLALEYRVPESQRWNRPRLAYLGVGSNNFRTDRPGYSSEFDRALKNLSFGFVVNLEPDPVHFVDVRSQTIYTAGFDEVDSVGSFADLARTEAVATFASLRYVYRKLERPSVQVALSGGYRKLLGTARKSDLWQAIGSVFYRVGAGFDAGMQVQFKRFTGDLVDLFGESEVRVQFALVYSEDLSWNDQFDERDSLLNLEHGYIP